MSADERITALEARLAALEGRVAELESPPALVEVDFREPRFSETGRPPAWIGLVNGEVTSFPLPMDS